MRFIESSWEVVANMLTKLYGQLGNKRSSILLTTNASLRNWEVVKGWVPGNKFKKQLFPGFDNFSIATIFLTNLAVKLRSMPLYKITQDLSWVARRFYSLSNNGYRDAYLHWAGKKENSWLIQAKTRQTLNFGSFIWDLGSEMNYVY